MVESPFPQRCGSLVVSNKQEAEDLLKDLSVHLGITVPAQECMRRTWVWNIFQAVHEGQIPDTYLCKLINVYLDTGELPYFVLRYYLTQILGKDIIKEQAKIK